MNDSHHQTLADFINAEMDKRKMSQREFAKLIGVNQSTLSRTIGPDKATPSLELLIKLANNTGASLVGLMKIAFPDAPIELPDVQSQLIADRIMRLGDSERAIVENLVISLVEKELNKKK